MNSPYRAHPAFTPSPAPGNTIPFPGGQGKATPPPTPPAAPPAEATLRLVKLVTLEGEIRQLPTVAAILFHALNDARALLGFQQGWFLRRSRTGRFTVEAVSDVPSIDVTAPLIQLVTRTVNACKLTREPHELALAAVLPALPHGLLAPLTDREGEVFAVVLLARATAWPVPDRSVAQRAMATYAHALCALTPPALLRRLSLPRWAMIGIPLVLALLLLVPVPMTALAPFEVVADEPRLVTAPMDGAIARVAAEANGPVRRGDELFALEDTQLQAEAAIAAQKVQVAESRLATARNGAFQDVELKRTLATAEQELLLAQAERDYAASLLARSVVRADRDGLLIYSARNDWLGRPVRTGEKVMEIADPTRVTYRIELAVADAITLGGEKSVWLFLDADPLHPRSGMLTETSYHAHPTAAGGMAFVLMAAPSDNAKPERIGLRGTAQIVGGRVPLGFYLLRRPISALRQHFGW